MSACHAHLLPFMSLAAARRPQAPAGARNQLEACADPSVAADLSLYRDRTAALLRRYFRLSVELGRLPSLLGREFFRTRVTSYRMHTFEDAVIFVHDVEHCLEALDAFSRSLLGRVVMQAYSQREAAILLRCSRRQVATRLPEALDRLTELFLACGLMDSLPR